MNILVISVVVSAILIFLVLKSNVTYNSNLTSVAPSIGKEDDDEKDDASCIAELNALKKALKAKHLERKKTCSEQIILIKEKIQKSQNQIDILKNHRNADANPMTI